MSEKIDLGGILFVAGTALLFSLLCRAVARREISDRKSTFPLEAEFEPDEEYFDGFDFGPQEDALEEDTIRMNLIKEGKLLILDQERRTGKGRKWREKRKKGAQYDTNTPLAS